MKLTYSTLIGITAGLLISFSAQAVSSSYPFKNSIAPGATLKMPTDKLYTGPAYDISCKIWDQDVKRQDHNAIKITSSKLVDVSVDGIKFNNTQSVVAKTKMTGSEIKISTVYQNTTLSIANYDFTDYIVAECIASVHEGNT